MYVKVLKKTFTEDLGQLPYLTNNPIFITENKFYSVYGKFLICGNVYYLICNDLYSIRHTSGLMLYDSNLFASPYGCESQYWTRNTLREDKHYLEQNEYDNNLCFPEYFYIPNFLFKLHMGDKLCSKIFSFYKELIDKENQ